MAQADEGSATDLSAAYARRTPRSGTAIARSLRPLRLNGQGASVVLFNSPIFLFGFLPLTIALYIAMRWLAGPRAVLGLLLTASVVFYGWWNPAYLPLLGILSLVNFALAQAMLVVRRRGRVDRVSILLALGVGFDLLALGYFKYTDFLIGSLNELFSRDFPLQHIMLPLGISFFTFQKIAYLIDASRGEVDDHDFLEYCFFVMFFPQLIAGPIVHHREIFSQLKGSDAFAVRPTNLMVGLSIFIIGLFKKVVLADNLAPHANIVFDAAAEGRALDFFIAWQGAFAFSLQLYFDFSGYSEMALGASRMFGVQLPINFNSPYRALSINDFWRRWHMTLSRFLRDYVYFPLGGSRRGSARHYLNLFLTMAVSGLWHGAAWHYVLWGMAHGVGLVLHTVWRLRWRPLNAWWSRMIARLVTFFSMAALFVLFRAPSVEVAGVVYDGMRNLPQDLVSSLGSMGMVLGWLGFRFDGPSLSASNLHSVLWLLFWIGFLWLVPNTPQLFARFHPAINYGPGERRRDAPLVPRLYPVGPWLEWTPNAVTAVAIGVLAALAGLSLYHVSEFLYFEF